jgi:uncharacterized RDD family membrane protein YckC
MMYDSVREELASKISPLPKSSRLEITSETRVEISRPLVTPPAPPQNFAPLPPVQSEATPAPVRNSAPLAPPIEQTPAPPAPKTIEKIETSEITAKPTSPTLVEFRNKNATLPEWRLQLQNAVRKRSGGEQTEAVSTQYAPVPRPVTPTQGATALKVEPAIQENPAASNPKLAAALRRIEQSRQQFYAEEKPKLTVVPPPLAPEKNYPFTVVNPSGELPVPEQMPLGKFESKTFPIQPQPAKFDTNKLPPLSEVVETDEAANNRPANVAVLKAKPLGATADVQAYGETENGEEEFEEFDDCPPFSLRFNAGLFDLIIGGFASFVLLSPFVILNGNLFSFEGFFAFLATCTIVMFVYLTTSIAFFGRTLGMRLFSLEIIDVEENDYPTFHQAAVNSVVYLFSLALGGLGFLPALFNDERRAAHDLAAGTIVVKEF